MDEPDIYGSTSNKSRWAIFLARDPRRICLHNSFTGKWPVERRKYDFSRKNANDPLLGIEPGRFHTWHVVATRIYQRCISHAILPHWFNKNTKAGLISKTATTAMIEIVIIGNNQLCRSMFSLMRVSYHPI